MAKLNAQAVEKIARVMHETVRAWQTLLENEERRRKEAWAERAAKAAASGRQLLQEFARALGMEV